MIRIIIVGAVMVWVTAVFHAAGTIPWNVALHRRLARRKGPVKSWDAFYALAGTAVFLLLMLMCEAVMWAVLYYAFGEHNGLTTFQTALAFSFETFTTVGYGDITLNGLWRIIAGVEAANGILLFGWSSASLYTIVSFIWSHASLQPPHKGPLHGTEHG